MIGVAAIVAVFAGPAFADDLEGAYVGGGIGVGRIAAGTAGLAPFLGNVDQTHFAYDLSFGIHPTSTPLALELQYLDLGKSDISNAGPAVASGTVSQRGGGLFLIYYLPTPIVQVYVKGGGSRITTHTDVLTSCTSSGCLLASSNPTNNAFAFGAGVQWVVATRWAVRGEYERFNAGGGNPSLLTVGVAWTFL